MKNLLISLLVTDLDNTLYDWVTFFARTFYSMVDVATKVLDVPEETLLDELREVHQRHYNTEHPYALLETRTVLAKYPGLSRARRAALLEEVFHKFNRCRDQLLILYPGVEETLRSVYSQGVAIVGHTEATVPNALFRLQKLGIDQFFDRVYAPAPLVDDDLDAFFAGARVPSTVEVTRLRQNERKPDPRVLFDICRGMGVEPKRTLYVGDSIARDIGMAKEAGARTAWAEYGNRYDPALWDRLVRITHWSAEDVERTQAAKERYGHTLPDVTLHESFAEISLHFSFEPTKNLERADRGEKSSRSRA